LRASGGQTGQQRTAAELQLVVRSESEHGVALELRQHERRRDLLDDPVEQIVNSGYASGTNVPAAISAAWAPATAWRNAV